MITVVFLFKFFTGEANLIGIDDNDVIARIDVGSERGFIFTAKNHRDLTCKTTENHIGSVDHIPLSFDFRGLCHISFHNGKDLLTIKM